MLPGLIEVPPGSDIPVRALPVRTAPGRTRADAPTVIVRRGDAFALRVNSLPPNRTMQVAVARSTQGRPQWESIGTTKVSEGGRANLPALLSTRTTTLTIRLTSGSIVRYLEVSIRP